MDIFHTNTMTLYHENDAIVERHLAVQLDDVNIPLNLEVNTSIPTDWYDLYSIGWISPIPIRGDYFVDEGDSTKYSVFGDPKGRYTDHLEMRVSCYAGTTP
jgi:hypothetical protein